MQKEKLITDNTEIQRIIREYCEHSILINGQPRGNGQILRKEQPPKTEPEINRNYEQPSYKH